MNDYCIRRLTPNEIDAREERAQELYDRLYAEIEYAEREEWDREFGPGTFKPNGSRVHGKVMIKMREMGEH